MQRASLLYLSRTLTEFCRQSDKKIVLLIDEIDTATNNQVFIDFLAQLYAHHFRMQRASLLYLSPKNSFVLPEKKKDAGLPVSDFGRSL